MNKKDYSELHRLLAILRYELEIIFLETDNKKYREQLRGQISSIENIMKIFIVEE
jgi:hypothetical protein